MDQQTIIHLLEKHAARQLSPAEATSLEQWLQTADAGTYHQLLQLSDVPDSYKLYPPMPEHLASRIEAGLDAIDGRGRIVRMRWLRIAAAAVILAAVVTGGWMMMQHMRQQSATVAGGPFIHDVKPGGNRATLTLGDGSVISLDEAENGNLGTQGNVKVVKLDSGQLAYQAKDDVGEVVYNTLNTPRGGQFRITLPDGTKVWINAASSLHFPTAFRGKERLVELKGEAYFEVAQNAAMPFKVKLNDMTVTVLGTSFNVMAYDDEGYTSTTLVSGAVRLETGSANTLLKPLQEGVLKQGGSAIAVKQANLPKVMAWKDGMFYFEKADINQIFRQLVRWYDVEPVFEGGVPQKKFVGIMSRNTTLAGVLKILEAADNNVKFRIEGKKVYIKFN